jgi:2-aminoethylphosphonate-pyruvate transaminase
MKEGVCTMMTASGRTVLLNPGPVNVSPRVAQAMLRGDLCHREREFGILQARIRESLCRAFAPHGDYTAVLLTGSGTAALEAAVASSLHPQRKMLVINNGVYGARMAQIASVHGFDYAELHFPWTSPPDLGQIDRALGADPAIEVVSLVHHETTTGLLNPVAAVGDIVRRHGRVLLVDSISGLGGEEVDVAGADIALCVGTANKCIQGLPGVSFVLVKNTDMARMQALPPRTLYLHLPMLYAHQQRESTPFTPAIQAMYAFDEALQELLEEGVPQRIARYRMAASQLREGFTSLGLKYLLPPDLQSNTITSLELPSGFTYEVLHDALKARGYVIYAGQGDLAARIFRIANMGDLTGDQLRGFLTALREVLAK